jgi:cyclopropane fatty-acyl-phospholipid synthase-like methyltransferase
MNFKYMKPATNPNVNYKALVQQGYDLCAAAYEEARRAETHSDLNLLIDCLANNARVLDIGCGAGIPITKTLAQYFQVTGVDISSEQVRRAQINFHTGIFMQGDIMQVDFSRAAFDAVVAFYSIFHLPREEHAGLFRRIHKWLKPKGYLLAILTSSSENSYTEDNFFGVEMCWSNYGLDEYKLLFEQVGFQLLDTKVIGHGYTKAEQMVKEQHPLIFAQVSEVS